MFVHLVPHTTDPRFCISLSLTQCHQTLPSVLSQSMPSIPIFEHQVTIHNSLIAVLCVIGDKQTAKDYRMRENRLTTRLETRKQLKIPTHFS
ncbi:hypothetical protein L2E82_38262 [Cichorium intybus]|uniref:Uncharacterized protein n=1 Tax=Cichorium intybus TaxID=13427 RepID=A0ACB9AFQ9_CICIN|nr:hypothetical protein L2E82_38262 [Cichorium intybus]